MDRSRFGVVGLGAGVRRDKSRSGVEVGVWVAGVYMG